MAARRSAALDEPALSTSSRRQKDGEATVAFFGSREEDALLERTNEVFWQNLIRQIRLDLGGEPAPRRLLDVGCHRGGLLERLAHAFHASELWGVEPLDAARQQARFRLQSEPAEVTLLTPSQWPSVPSNHFDLVTCHEVVHLVEDLPGLFGHLYRVLRPRASAYVVCGCHSENPLWPRWKQALIDDGNEVYDHAPLDILRQAAEADLHTAARPLRREGWVLYDPTRARFTYGSAHEMFDHQYRHKLLFRFTREPEMP